MRKISVLVAEDSSVTRMLLTHLLESDPQICVLATVADGQAAIDFVQKKKPDVVLMDIHMPRVDGFEATRRIMETHAVPIIICSAISDPKDVVVTFQAMQAGAVACIEKPRGREDGDFSTAAAHLVQTVKLMSEVKVVRRTRRPLPAPAPLPQPLVAPAAAIQIVGIGASTGGPPALQAILSRLPPDFPAPLLVVQHIAQGFLTGMAEWLRNTTGWKVQVGVHGTIPSAGHVYLAPDDFHMGVSHGGAILLSRQPPENHVRPAVSFLFRSLASTFGARAAGVLLTGMGADGARELRVLRDAGAVTFAQDRESSVVHGMPGVAIAAGAAVHVGPPHKIAEGLIELIDAAKS